MTAPSQRILFWTIVWFCILILSVPTIIVVGASFTTANDLVPARRLYLQVV